MRKRYLLLLFLAMLGLNCAWNSGTAVLPQETFYYVAVNGSDTTGNGSEARPWATISHALDSVPDGTTILVQPGTYFGQVDLRGTFIMGVTVRSAVPYQARLRHDHIVVTCFYGQGITLEGFDIAHSGPGAEPYVIQIQDLRGDVSGDEDAVSRIVFRNNVLHDSYNDDIVKLNNGARQVTFSGNIFYNQGGPGLDSHIDINSVTDVIIQDNIFFNDFAGSGRVNNNDMGSYIVIKDSNGDHDANLGSHNIIVRRNILLNWEGDISNSFIAVGEDSVSYFQASDVRIENNLMLGNSPNPMRAVLVVRGIRNLVFRHNTIVGDLPSKAFAMRLDTQNKNPNNQQIDFYNNIWSDPTGTMGANLAEENDFSDTPPRETDSYTLLNNLYWNGGNSLPLDDRELVNYLDDPQRLVDNPLLAAVGTVLLPRWEPENGRFADGSTTIREAFINLVQTYAVPDPCSATIDTADPAYAPVDDILGNMRELDQLPDIGAYELILPKLECSS
ncbi:MAG: hypothetical protein H6667_19900 [Ardenticatenaceae bacterium]|nr:hypothetical protein [Ardenticatenaceae bacterium]MCB9443912.1 hypothetical protein [Ardenticatenaceae bacterium]